MPNYELTLILTSGDKKILTEIKKILAGGKIKEEKELGRKDLSYPIKKKTEGFFYVINFQVEGKEVAKIREKLLQNDKILRHLLVRKGD